MGAPLFCRLGSATVAEQFAQANPPDALSETPAQHEKGMLIFFNPAVICKSPGATPSGVLNQATLFHEALHGFYGIMDRSLIGPSLLSVFGFDQLESSLKITSGRKRLGRRGEYMRKLKLRWFLPVLFLAFSAIELAWQDHINALLEPLRTYVGRVGDLWHALNAPALFFLAIGIHLAPVRAPNFIANVPMETELFLVGGIVFWAVLGEILDRRPLAPASKIPRAIVRVTQTLIVLWGIYLCSEALHAISATDYLGRRVPGSMVDGALVLLWSLILIILPARSLTGAARSWGKSSQAKSGEHA